MDFQLVAVYVYNLITWEEEAEESRHSGTAEQMAVVSTWRGLDFSFSRWTFLQPRLHNFSAILGIFNENNLHSLT